MSVPWAKAPKPYVAQLGDDLHACPGCGFTKWLRGRVTAECGVCQYAIDLQSPVRPGGHIIVSRGVAANTGTKTGEGIFS